MPGPYSIAFVERSTGISRETLRIWERRYGFPSPLRDAAGDRSYSADELERLRVIKRLLDQGHRPGKVVLMSHADLVDSAQAISATRVSRQIADELTTLLMLLQNPDPARAREWLENRLAEQGLAVFLLQTLAPMNEAVGDAWATGRLRIHEEHLYTELVRLILRQATASLACGEHPRILMTTLPEEQHELGLMMAQALFCLAGAHCLYLGVNMPPPEIVAAVERHRADVLALSFSPAYARRRIAMQLVALRAELPPRCEIWVGGRITARLRAIEGVRFCARLNDVNKLLARWRARENIPGSGC